MKNPRRIGVKGRLLAGLVFTAAVAVFFLVHWAAVNNKINVAWFAGPCGFKQRYGLPCPGCGVTTAAVAFARGSVLTAFYIQPAAALFCCVAVLLPVLPFVMAVFGADFGLLSYLATWKVKFVIIALLIIIASAWAVTLARALAQKN